MNSLKTFFTVSPFYLFIEAFLCFYTCIYTMQQKMDFEIFAGSREGYLKIIYLKVFL